MKPPTEFTEFLAPGAGYARLPLPPSLSRGSESFVMQGTGALEVVCPFVCLYTCVSLIPSHCALLQKQGAGFWGSSSCPRVFIFSYPAPYIGYHDYCFHPVITANHCSYRALMLG
ncbi:hypothetical protein FKM82_004872 [Ascaphus truei]